MAIYGTDHSINNYGRGDDTHQPVNAPLTHRLRYGNTVIATIYRILTLNFNIANVLPQRKLRPLTLEDMNDILEEQIRERNEAAQMQDDHNLGWTGQ